MVQVLEFYEIGVAITIGFLRIGGGWGRSRWVGGCGLASMSRHAARASSRMAASVSSNIAINCGACNPEDDVIT